MRHLWRSIERRFAETPFEIPVALYLGCVGLAGLLSGTGITPATLDGALPIWLVQAWTIGIAAGGIGTVAGRLTQNDRTEAAGLLLLGYGTTLYAAVLATTGLPATLTAAAAMVSIATGCAIRLRVLAKSHQARRLAAQIEVEGGQE